MRGVTLQTLVDENGRVISTHTPHARRDIYHQLQEEGRLNFNSHASCEA